MGVGLTVTIVISWLLLTILIGVCASRWGREGLVYSLLSFFLSPLVGCLVLLINGKNTEELEKERLKVLKKCPYCAEYIKREATICRFCGKEQGDCQENHDEAIDVDWEEYKRKNNSVDTSELQKKRNQKNVLLGIIFLFVGIIILHVVFGYPL